MATEAQNLSREMAHPYLTGTAPRTNRLSNPPCQRIITLIMQNKANLLDTQMTVRSAKTNHYENDRLPTRPKNKPNQTQSQTHRLRAYPNNRALQPAVIEWVIRIGTYSRRMRSRAIYETRHQVDFRISQIYYPS